MSEKETNDIESWVWPVLAGFFIWIVFDSIFYGLAGGFIIYLFLKNSEKKEH